MKEDELAPSLPLNLPSIPCTEIKEKTKGLFKYLGPAFIVSVAYMDPPNTTVGTRYRGFMNL